MKIRTLILFLLIFAVHPFMSQAQDKEHMTFKDIPITGHLDDFVQKLENIGFKIEEKDGSFTKLMGTFVNKNCEVFVVASPRSKTVYKIGVYLPKETSWYSIKKSYNDFKAQYTTKYGKPSSQYSFFSDPYYEGDGYEMTAISKDKCTYSAFWDFEQGNIMIEISEYEQIYFGYEDAKNILIKKAETNAIINNDI